MTFALLLMTSLVVDWAQAANGLVPTPIIATTGNTQHEDLVRYSASGFDGCEAKPVNIASLMKDLDAFLEAKVRSSVLSVFPDSFPLGLQCHPGPHTSLEKHFGQERSVLGHELTHILAFVGTCRYDRICRCR